MSEANIFRDQKKKALQLKVASQREETKWKLNEKRLQVAFFQKIFKARIQIKKIQEKIQTKQFYCKKFQKLNIFISRKYLRQTKSHVPFSI